MVEPAAGIGAIVVLVGVSAFFSSSEIALFSLEPHRGAAATTGDSPAATSLGRLREDPHRLLVTILVGNNLVNIAIATLATSVALAVLPAGVAEVAATLTVTTIVLLFGEIVPKSYGVANAESWSLRAARPLLFVQRALRPVVAVFEALSGLLNRLVGGVDDIERPYLSREELTAIVETAEAAGVIHDSEESMIQRVFRFADVTAGDVMIPRADVVAVDISVGVEGALRTCAAERLTRLPVYRDHLDTVVGYVDLRDLVAADADADLESLLSPVLHVYEGRTVDEVLADLQDDRVELAVVFDEFGAVEGLLTTEDIVEEVVGEIYDVGERRLVLPLGPTTVSARGRATVAEVCATLDVAPPGDAAETTMAGLLSKRLGRSVQAGDTVTVGPLSVTAQAVEDNRVYRVLVELLVHGEESDPPS